MQLTKPSQTRMSTTDYMLYGSVTATIRHDARAGLVAAFIFMSDVMDEIDWEFTTADPQDAQTNIFALGHDPNALSVNQTGSWSVNQFHTFGVNWQPDSITWSIDGNNVRTLTRQQANGNFPQTPARVQLSVWAGGNVTNPEGVIAWAGGEIDWNSPTYQQQGYYGHEITRFTMNCASPSLANVTTTGTGANLTSWIYTGNNISNSDRPEFQLSRNPIPTISDPSAGGHAGLPGWASTTNAKVSNGNSWDGSGDTLPGRSSSNSNAGSLALKYGVPIAAALVGAALIWGLSVWCWRKRRNAKLRPEGTGITFGNLPATASAAGAALTGGNKRASKYQMLQDSGEDAPMGAQKVGSGYGPAPGPRPGAMSNASTANVLRYDDASAHSHADSYALGSVQPASNPFNAKPYQSTAPYMQQTRPYPPQSQTPSYSSPTPSRYGSSPAAPQTQAYPSHAAYTASGYAPNQYASQAPTYYSNAPNHQTGYYQPQQGAYRDPYYR